MLRGIAIYEIKLENDTVSYLRTMFHSPKRSVYTLFTDTAFDEIQSLSMPTLTLSDLESPLAIHMQPSREHHYLKRITGKPFLIAICSKTILDPKELAYLCLNITATLSPTCEHTLDMIMENPLAYNNKDCRLQKIVAEIEEIRDIMHKNIDKLLLRGDQIEALHAKSVELHIESKKFNKEATILNRYCSYCVY